MEAIVVLVAILAYLEVRDQRSKKWALKNMRLLNGRMATVQASLSNVYEKLSSLEKVSRETSESVLVVSEVRAIAEDSRIKMDTILKEYKINGIPMGLDRGKRMDWVTPNFDAVEGL